MWIGLTPLDRNRNGCGSQSTTIDRSCILEAIQKCDDTHEGACHSISEPWARIDHVPELLLIDVERQCLAQQPGSCKYLALSYVWGSSVPTPSGGFLDLFRNRIWGSSDRSTPLQTTTKNLKTLLREGAFEDLRARSLLPATIEDSIILTRELKLKYLWYVRVMMIGSRAIFGRFRRDVLWPTHFPWL